MLPIRPNAASTSATVSDGSAAGAGWSLSVAQPTPIWRWVSSPDSHATAAGVSAGASSRSSAASRSTFPPRAEVARTAADVSTSSRSSTRPWCHHEPP